MGLSHLILFVTARCNSKCVMCFNYNLNASDAGELTLDEYGKIAQNLKSRLKVLMISGGEPSLRKDLPEICETFYKQCGVKRIEIPFNGHDGERIIESVERILRLCPAAQINVRLSIDGMGEIHDTQRGVSGSFDKVMSTHEALFGLSKRYRNLKRGVTTTVTTINVGHLGEWMDYIYNLPSRPDYHDIMICRIQAGSRTDQKLLIEPDEYKKALNIQDSYAPFYYRKRYNGFILGVLGLIRHKMLNRVYLNAYRNRRIINCRAPQFIRVIEADGMVRICELKEIAGNIKDYDYDLNKMDRILGLSSKRFNCACTHPCFIVPSLSYPSNIIRCCASIFIDNIAMGE